VRLVQDIMSPDLVTASPDDAVETVETTLLTNGINSLPIIEDDRVVGVISSWDMTRHAGENQRARDIMTAPVMTVAAGDTTEDAARKMLEAFVHHLVVVDADGRALGIISSFDLLRELADI
jgi:CBS domain-containing protein